MAKGSSKLSSESVAPNPVKTSGKIKLQGELLLGFLPHFILFFLSKCQVLHYLIFHHCTVRKVKLGSDEPPASCSFSSLKQPKINEGAIGRNVSNLRSSFYPRLKSVWKNLPPRAPANASFRQSLDNIQARAKRIKKVPRLLKAVTSNLCNASSSSHGMYIYLTLLIHFDDGELEDSRIY